MLSRALCRSRPLANSGGGVPAILSLTQRKKSHKRGVCAPSRFGERNEGRRPGKEDVVVATPDDRWIADAYRGGVPLVFPTFAGRAFVFRTVVVSGRGGSVWGAAVMRWSIPSLRY